MISSNQLMIDTLLEMIEKAKERNDAEAIDQLSKLMEALTAEETQ